MHSAKRFFPFLSWPKPTPQLLKSEAFAGLSVGLMVIPQGVAYAALAGMPLITGIYASLLPALVAVLFSASPRLSVGPTALTSILIAASLSGMAAPGSAEWVNLTVWLSLMTGLLQVVLGFARFGWLLNLVSSPVLMAFTQGAGVLIISSQMPALLGLTNGWSTLLTGAGIDWASMLFGVVTLVLLLLARRWRPTFPTVLVVVLGAAGASWALGLEASGTAVVGALPQGLPALFVPSVIEWDVFKQLVLPTLVITLVSFLETASSAKVDNDRSGKRWDQDQDLIGQGLAKVASGLCGAFPTSSSFSRSALNLYAGAQSAWATIFSVAVILVILLFFTAVLQPVPQSVLAAIVVAVLMVASVKSLPATAAIMLNLPLALVGGVVAVLLTGGVLSIASLIGFITLFGVAVRNGLLLVDNYNRRHAEGQPVAEVIREGSLERLNAILMTALSSALGALPLALAFGAGNEILQPLAVVVLGGLITSTALTLLVLPALYVRFGRWLLPSRDGSSPSLAASPS